MPGPSPAPSLPQQRLRSSGSQLPPTTGRTTGRAARARMRSAASRPSSCLLGGGWKATSGPSPAPSLSWWAWWPAMTGARRSAWTLPSRPAMSPPQQRLRLQEKEKEKRLLLSNSARVIEQIPSRIPPGPTAGQRSSPVCSGLLRSSPVCSGLLRSAPVCSGLLRSAPVCSGLLRSALVCSGLLWSAPDLLWICSGLRRWHGQPRRCHPSRFSLTADGSRNQASAGRQ